MNKTDTTIEERAIQCGLEAHPIDERSRKSYIAGYIEGAKSELTLMGTMNDELKNKVRKFKNDLTQLICDFERDTEFRVTGIDIEGHDEYHGGLIIARFPCVEPRIIVPSMFTEQDD